MSSLISAGLLRLASYRHYLKLSFQQTSPLMKTLSITKNPIIGLTSLALVITIVTFAIYLVKEEIKTSKFQSQYISAISKQLSYKLNAGPSDSIRFPEYGPYDQRLGYTQLPTAIKRLEKSGFGVTSQAELSPMMAKLVDDGLFMIYHEKTQAGLTILDRNNQEIFNNIYPTQGYSNFEAIPPVVLYTLLFIENRELLNNKYSTINPAIEWDRLGYASMQMVANKLGLSHDVPGGSTLATQIEKYRHSKNGFTNSVIDKFRQMGSASLRAYLLGPDTLEMRREIALAYLNSMPLAATPKLGEIHGLGDGLSAWFGADFTEVNKLLNQSSFSSLEHVNEHQALAYRQVLSLLLSQRRPSYLLGPGYPMLETLTNSYLRLLAEQGIISSKLRDTALRLSVHRTSTEPNIPAKFMTEKKTQSVLRSRLANMLGVKTSYDLDRLDLTVKTTLDYQVQTKVTQELHRLSEPENARSAGIFGSRLLNEKADLSSIIYSLMLFERGENGNLLRVQTDNFDQPLDINEGIRLDLGSTSKLRTMVHFLELIADIYQRYKNVSASELAKIELHPRDYLSAWVIQQLRANPTINLEGILNQALDRKYSGSSGESFFTGGGLHHFNNFEKSESGRIFSVRHALRDSVNLVFIRLMRDIVYHHLYRPDGIARWLEVPGDPRRLEYLERFADREGIVYLRRFYAKYAGKSTQEALALLTRRVVAKPSRLSMLYRSIYPNHHEYDLQQYLLQHVNKKALENEDIYELFDKFSIEKFDLQDQGYITKIHPLELWLVRYLTAHPKATRDEVITASAEERLEVYRWLLKSKRPGKQLRRIMTLLEQEAFKEIHEAWRRVGYPFNRLTPSYATSIGASGDRPAALAELMGILVNDGIKQPIVRFENLHFAQQTPYETVLSKQANKGVRVFAPEIAKVAREALIGVVEGGTASRLKGIYTGMDAKPLAVGGKTGTGDHRQEVWGERGHLLQSKFISRAATFVFFIGDRFFGVITAYVAGEDAEKYHFTSSLPVQIVKSLQPTLSPLINGKVENDNVKLAVAKL